MSTKVGLDDVVTGKVMTDDPSKELLEEWREVCRVMKNNDMDFVAMPASELRALIDSYQ